MTKPKKRHRKLETPKKQYALHDCALYSIRGKGQLVQVLLWPGTYEELTALARDQHNYKCWKEDDRPVQEARPRLRAVQARIATLLRRVSPPNYRHSGVKKRSFLTNAKAHIKDEPMLQFDVRKFYPSTTHKHIFNLFHHKLACAADISELLAELCCVHGQHLPTGGVHSEVIAFYCHKEAFDLLDMRATLRGGRMSTYVDDVGISAPHISLTDLEWARKLLRARGLRLHPGKSFVTRKGEPRMITGVRLTQGRAIAPSHQQQRIRELNCVLAQASSIELAREAAKKLMGHYDHIAQIEPEFWTIAQGNRSRLINFLK